MKDKERTTRLAPNPDEATPPDDTPLAATDQVAAEPPPDVALAARPPSTEPARPVSPPRQVKVGDSVHYNGSTGVVIAVASPENPRSAIDLVYTDSGKRRIASGVARGLDLGSWSFEDDAEAGRTRTPLELVAEARARGERVPQVGLLVRFAQNLADDHEGVSVHIRPIRATISRVHNLAVVDLILHDAAPPADPEAPEPQRGIYHRSELVGHSSHSQAAQLGHRHGWEYTDDDKITPFGPVTIKEVFPPYSCTRCRTACQQVTPVLPDPRSVGVMGRSHPPRGNLCPSCVVELLTWLAPPTTQPVPA